MALVEKGLEGCIETDEFGPVCGVYAVMLTALIQMAERASNMASTTSTKKSSSDFDWSHLKVPAVDAIKRCLNSELARIVVAHSNREAIISSLVKSTHLLLEAPNATKSANLKKGVLDCWTLAVAKHDYCLGMKVILLQDLNYSESLAETLAEFIGQLAQVQDNPALSCDVLSALGSHRFTTQESGSVKAVALFISNLSRLCPKEALRNLPSFISQLDSESYVLRMAMIDALGNLIQHLGQQDIRTDQNKAQLKSFLTVLEERLLDVNAFVRAKVISIFSDSLKSGALPINQRSRLLSSGIKRIADKSSNVRRKAIQIMGDFLRTHPFCVEGGELSLAYFKERLCEIDGLISNATLKEEPADVMDAGTPASEFELPTQRNNNSGRVTIDPAQVSTLLLQKRYYTDAVQFASQLESVIPILCQLLGSTTKTEVVDVIDFFVEAYLYRLDGAEAGIRRMMHLIWERDLSHEDGTKQSIKEYLFDAYRRVYLETDERLSGREKCAQIAQNLTGLVGKATSAELASLQRLLSGLLEHNWISDGVVNALLSMLPDQSSVVTLSLLAKGKRTVLTPKVDLLLKAGFGPNTSPLAAQYTLLALRYLSPSGRLSPDSPIFTKIVDFIRVACIGSEWLEPVSESIRTIYALCTSPSVICQSLIQDLFSELFCSMDDQVDVNLLIRLLHIVGHVALCESSHLDAIERHWKASQVIKMGPSELEQIGASAEDDFSELIAYVRDNELLKGENSLLTTFGPILAHISSNPADFPEPGLQRVASLSFAKFMTISPSFCQEHLALFLTMLERSPDSVVRSNFVIAFGDIVHTFARLIDENISYLFARLMDSDTLVRKNTLLVLTHLTLTGLIKVKGQIGDIARSLLDDDESIVNLTRLFFHELASKDPLLIYNHLPDILSSLASSPISETDFQTIMRFLMDFIKKERQIESLLDKLCQRFRLCPTVRQARDVAFCLSMVQYNSEKSFRRIVDAFPLYQDKLADLQTYRFFVEILHKARKTCRGGTFSNGCSENLPVVSSAGEVKSLFEEFETKLLRAAGQTEGMQIDDDPLDTYVDDCARKNRSRPTAPRKSKKKSNLPSDSELSDDQEIADEAVPQAKVREKLKPFLKQSFK